MQESSLSIGAKLATGGQGHVHDLGGRGAGYVYKEYLDPVAVNGAELAELVALPARMPPRERDCLLERTAWPLARVLDGTLVKGFIMKRVPERFWALRFNKPKPRELQYLLFPPKPQLWGEIVPLDAPGRLAVARETADLFRLLHAKGMVIGDVSMSNLLWSDEPVGIFLIDCDGIRLLGRPPVMPQPETVDWNDPQQPTQGPDQDTDRYKLALLVARVLTRTDTLRPGDELPFVPGLPERVTREVAARFLEAARPRGARPGAEHWIMALSDRGTIELPPLPPVRNRPSIPEAPLDQPRQRPLIHFSPRTSDSS